jgi:hypothetical protein
MYSDHQSLCLFRVFAECAEIQCALTQLVVFELAQTIFKDAKTSIFIRAFLTYFAGISFTIAGQ